MAEEQKGIKKKKRPTALKRQIQDQKKYLKNRMFKSRVRTAMNSLEKSISEKDQSTIKTCLSAVYSLMDKGVKRGIFKKNKADRTKSRLTARAVAK